MAESDDTNCSRCRNPARSGIKCSRCGKISHKSCLKIMKTVKFIDDEHVICCAVNNTEESSNSTEEIGNEMSENCGQNVNSSTNSNLDKVRITYLEEIIRQKDLVISNQCIAIKSLSEQIILLKDFRSTTAIMETPPCSSKAPQTTNGAIPKNSKVKPVVSGNTRTPTNATISGKAVSNAIHNAQAKSLCNNIINLEADKLEKVRFEKDKSANRPRNRARSLLVGKQETSSKCPFKAAEVYPSNRLYEYHVTNLDITTDATSLADYLKGFAPNIKVEKLNSKNPEKYSSFKLVVPVTESSSLMDTDVWPCGVVLNRFFRSKGQRESTTGTTSVQPTSR